MEEFQFQPAESPFQVSVILKEIFKKLEYPDLANCRQVSKLWDCEASKQLWKVGRIRNILWDWTTSRDDLEKAFVDGDELVHLTGTEEILDVFGTRISSSNKSLVSVKIKAPKPKALKAVFYRSHYPDVGRAVHGFLTDPILCNLLASIELEFFADLDVILRLLSEVPNLLEFSVTFDVDTFLKTQSLIPKWHKTSPVRKLELVLAALKGGKVKILQQDKKFGACLRVILRGCIMLKDLRIQDYTSGTLLKVMDADFVKASLKNPELVETLALRSYDLDHDGSYTPPEKMEIINVFSKVTHLDVRLWGEVNLANWKLVFSMNYLPACIRSLKLSVCEEELDIVSCNKLIYEHLLDAGLGHLQMLTRLRIDSYFIETTNVSDWVEEWEIIEGGLALVRAKTMWDDKCHVDLRSHKHLRYLARIIQEKETFTAALETIPPTVKELNIQINPIGGMTDDDFRRDAALKAITGLEKFRIDDSCRNCTVAILEHVFARMKNLKFVQLPDLQFTEDQLKECGLENVTFSHAKLSDSVFEF